MKNNIIHGMFQDDYNYKVIIENQAKSTIETTPKNNVKINHEVKTKIKTKISKKI